MEIKRKLLRISPYFASIIAGLLFLFIGLEQIEDIRGLFISISAAFFALPLIYLFYLKAHNLSRKRLNKEIFGYAKMQIDTEMLSIINQLQKVVYALEEKDLSPTGVSKFLSLGKDDLKGILSKNEYLGFQVFKKWEVSEKNLHEILRNSFILKSLEDDQIISIISTIKNLRYLESFQKGEELYARTDKKATSYKIVAGRELNEENIKFPGRYLLLKDVGENKFLVADFGDFPPYSVNKLLQIFTMNVRYLEIYSDAIFDLTKEIKRWVDLTGGEFVVDIKMFRLGYKVTLDNWQP